MNQKERDYIRELALKVAEHAVSQKNKDIIKRWSDVNALRKPDRAPVWCRPVSAWNELLPQESLLCEDPLLRKIENGFRQILIKREIDDDTPVDDSFPVAAVFDVEPGNIWGVDSAKIHSTEKGGAWAFDPRLKTEEDFNRLQIPIYRYNQEKTEAAMYKAHDLLGGILPVKMVCSTPLGATLGTYAAQLRGLTQIMMDTLDSPRLLHRLMAHLRDAVLHSMEQIEKTGLLTLNNRNPMTCSDSFGPEAKDGRYSYKNLWAGANSQEFDQISPAAWEEFCLNYQKPIFERFGYVCYGCCENLTHKMERVLSIPNLRIFVCSAWTSLDKALDLIGNQYTIMWRQKATEVVYPDDTGIIRRDLENGIRKLKGSYYQIVLRELETLAGHPDRLHEWTRTAKELAAKYA